MTAILERRAERNRMRRAARRRVSDGIEAWLETDEPTTLGTLNHAFGEKVIAAACLILMAPSALPIPTGGATHAFDVIAVLFTLQLAIGRRSVWLPERWERKEIRGRATKAVELVVRLVRRCERISHPRLPRLMTSRLWGSVMGLVMTGFVVAAFLSPPLSGLDTLPALGVVLLALGILLEDAAFAIAGLVVGLGGVALTITLGVRAAELIGSLIGG